jgi:LysR family nitrogen assimilation transcriptional regulator
MTPRQLTYFLRIAELGSFTRAAAVLHVAQPALSRQIKQLEDDLGVHLFARSDAGIRLTEAGVLLAERARVLLQQFENVRIGVSALATSVQGKLHFGMPPSLFDLVTIPLIAGYSQQYPAVRLSVTEGISSTVYQLVLSGDLDVGIVSSSESMTGLAHRPLIKEPLFLAYPPGSEIHLLPDGSVGLEEVARQPLALTRSPNAIRVLLDEAMESNHQKIRLLLESNSTRLLVKAVANGMGCTVNPYSALYESHQAGMVNVSRIKSLNVIWTLIYLRERNLSVAGEKLAELITQIASTQVTSGRWLGAEV